jgi:hypothetical protein
MHLISWTLRSGSEQLYPTFHFMRILIQTPFGLTHVRI